MHAHTSTFDNMAKITAYFSSSSSGRDVESLSERSRIEGDGDKRPTVEGAIDGDSLPRSEGDTQSYTTGKHVVGYKPAWESEFSWLVPCFSEGAVYAAVLSYAGENPVLHVCPNAACMHCACAEAYARWCFHRILSDDKAAILSTP